MRQIVQLNVEEAMRGAALAEPVAYQRRAHDWLTALSKAAEPNGLHLVRVGEIQIDVLEALRSQLLLKNGYALRDELLLRDIRKRSEMERIFLRGGEHALTLGSLASALGVPRVHSSPVGHVRRAVLESGYELKVHMRRAARVPVPLEEKPFMLVVPRTAGHLADLIPVAQELMRRGQRALFVANGLEERLSADAMPFISLGGRGHRQTLSFAWKALQAVHRTMDAAGQPSGFTADQVAVLRHTTLAVFTRLSVELGWFASRFNQLLNLTVPQVVAIGNPNTLEGRVAAMLAKARQIPTFAIEHGTVFPNDPMWAHCPVDLMMSWGPPSRRALIASGVPEDRILVTGAPRIDAYASSRNTADKRYVLVATSGAGDQVSLDMHLSFIERLYQVASRLKEVKWLVKLHPKDVLHHYHPIAERYPLANVELVAGSRLRQGVEIFEFLKHAHLLVTVTSSAALDAMALGVPVVSVIPDGISRFDHIEYLARGAARRVGTVEEWVEVMKSMLSGHRDAEQEARAQAYATEHYAHRGSASSRVVDGLLELADAREPA